MRKSVKPIKLSNTSKVLPKMPNCNPSKTKWRRFHREESLSPSNTKYLPSSPHNADIQNLIRLL